MAQRLLSISLGTSSAKLAEISKSGKKIIVYSAYDIQISEGLCDDGVILDVDALAKELKKYISQYKIKTKKLVFSIASKRIASKEVINPALKEKQLRSAITLGASEYFPVSNIDDYIINYSIVETVKTETSTNVRLNVIATPRDILEGYDKLASAMKMQVETIDFAGNSILQVLESQNENEEVCAILQLGYENTVINIMNGSTLILQRTVAYGLNALINAVAESVGLDEEDAIAFLEDNDIDKISGAYPDVKYVADSLINSIRRIFDFYNGKAGEHVLTHVKFIGDATYVNGIGASLEEGLGYTTKEIFTLNNVTVKSKSLTPEHATNFMANIGAVIAPMNLKYAPLGQEAGEKDDSKLPWRLVVLSAVGSVVLIGASYAMYYMAKTERDQLAAQYAAIEDIQTLEYQYLDANAKREAVKSLYDLTKGSSDMLPALFKDLEQNLPKGMTIDSLNVSGNEITFGAGGSGKASVAKILMGMKSLPYVEDVNIDYVSEVIEGADKYDSYSMRFILKPYVEEENAEESEQGEATENAQSLENGGEQ